MVPRMNFRIITQSMRRPVVLGSNSRFSRRAMSSAPPNLKESSDTIWIAGAAIITVGGLGFTLSSGGDNKASHHASSHTSVHKPAPGKKEEPDAPKGVDRKANPGVETGADSTEAQESIKRAVKSDEPSTAKSEEKKSAGSSKSEDDDYVKVSPEEVKGSLAQAEKADAPAVAKPAEEKEARSK